MNMDQRRIQDGVETDDMGFIPNFIFLSHHPRDKHTSPCASIYQAFIGEDRIADLAGYCNVTDDAESFKKSLTKQLAEVQHPHFLFNGFQSLLLPSSIVALSTAFAKAIPVTIYWHETAWNLRFLAEREAQNFKRCRELLQCLHVMNWVPTSQCLHSVATMFGFSLDSFRIVYEVVDLKSFAVNARAEPKPETVPIVIAGAGVPDERKGIDIFSYIANTVSKVAKRPVEFRWYAATDRAKNFNVPYPKAIKWMGHAPNFQDALKEVDIFVLTSRDDPSPLVVFEALATGHPAYAFATTGFNEMLPREFVALDPDAMCRKLCESIEAFRPDPQRFRAIAENFSVERFRDRAFRPRHTIPFNLPIFDQEVVDLYEERNADSLDARVAQLQEEQSKLLKLMRAVQRERTTLDGKGRRLEHVLKERDALKGITRRLASDLKIEHYRERRRLARASRKKNFPIPFLAKAENLKVVVLGNAPSVLERELGQKIDGFDVVIRVNNFRIKGFEKHIGSKTDYALISPACMPSEELSSLPASKVFVCGANMRDDYEKIKARLLDKDRGCKVLPPPENVLKSSIYVDALRLDMDFDLAENQWPSTGIVAVQWARDMHGKAATVYVHGFQFYADNRVTLSRYFDVTTKADGKHDFDREKAYMQSLLDKGAIKRL
ncbi:glycosyltransferase family 29 protein [Sinorhizobium alkalisoli]|uniref:glycosyltransferase family 29 protein n=1 Tax=Sinorhizobium alkalisoli TaxID=1752398 RepID=UPI00124F6DB0|nr:glycosyltransferase family 29 protein [Sinorhizobium alkalisoli]QFI65802.1 hypothetical protein EKH55_0928 [Sinorhizobium alkalisoli]